MLNQKPREIAAEVLLRRERGTDFVENLLDAALAQARLAPADRGLCQELVYGVVRWQRALDWLIVRKAPGRTQKPLLQVVLRLGLYQMFWLGRIPDHAAVHESVETAKRMGCGPQAGFLNAVLRGYARERDETIALLADLKIKDPALGWSHPQWLWERWLKLWGAESATRLLEWNDSPPPTYARVNTLRTTAAALAESWRAEGVAFTPCAWDWTGDDLMFRLDDHPSLAELPSFRAGDFYVQDPSTLLAVQLLEPRPGEEILDLCAAPGGKTTFIAQRMGNQGSVVATDAHADRLALIEQNCRRLGVTGVRTLLAGELPATPTFDRILLDAPCSNTGVLRRRVELRWRLQPAELVRLAAAQARLLGQAATRLKPGGTVVYSTCSLEPEENHAVVAQFLATNSGFRLEAERQLTPFADGVDGAYVARVRREVTTPE